ncbi:DUF1559 domain-containing protein [Novipirellula sp.]|uniref:DUF1559 family PulG-like putative transporter n=1 Tax=Novipirellula sp. TaxID=2795430 RepID=UPI003566BCC6
MVDRNLKKTLPERSRKLLASVSSTNRGMFQLYANRKIRDVLEELPSTVAMEAIIFDSGNRGKRSSYSSHAVAAALRSGMSGVCTVRPPNSELCSGQWADNPGSFSPSSFHQGGVHVLMGDGAVKFVTDSIEAGNQSAPIVTNSNNPGAKSPYGLWGSLGTRASKEVVQDF